MRSGKGEEDVDQPHQRGIDAAADVAGDDADRRSDQSAESDRDETDQKGDPGTVDDPGEDVPAEIVAAEEVAVAGRG